MIGEAVERVHMRPICRVFLLEVMDPQLYRVGLDIGSVLPPSGSRGLQRIPCSALYVCHRFCSLDERAPSCAVRCDIMSMFDDTLIHHRYQTLFISYLFSA